MKFFKHLFTYSLLLWGSTLFAQNLPYVHHTEREREGNDTNNLQYFFRQGTFYGHARYFFMATDNSDQLSDYYANAFGMGIGYETGSFKNFQVGISGNFIYNLNSSDLAQKDPLSKQGSRYELGLFDIENPNNHADLDRLEDLYIKYNYKQSDIKLGKQHIRTPFINPQDGRMRPTLVDGVILNFNQIKQLKIEVGLLTSISPRSTVKWYGIGTSIGVYNSGLNPDGSLSDYAGNIKSDHIAYIGITKKLGKQHEIQAWDMLVENVFNTSLVQYNGHIQLNPSNKIILGAQGIAQQAINHGGNEDQSKTYMEKNAKSYTFGGRLGISNNSLGALTFNYNRITSHGRYLMPREWGRDAFFTFMPRERNEGYGDLHAFNLVGSRVFGKSGLRADLSYGQYYLPDVKNTRLNKYGMPSYWQMNADIRYQAKGFFKGIELQLLYVYKGQKGSEYTNNNYVFNKVDMSLYNFVINYHF